MGAPYAQEEGSIDGGRTGLGRPDECAVGVFNVTVGHYRVLMGLGQQHKAQCSLATVIGANVNQGSLLSM
mgnify:CR=1 FL=1